MKRLQFCQGDVLTEARPKSVLEGLTETKPTVALGEATGHHHSFVGKQATGFFKEGDDNAGGGSPLADFVKVIGKPSELRHQEHGPISHPPGVYERTPQLEWDAVGMVRPVVD